MTYPLLPNQPFTEGDDWPPELAYFAFYAPIFDDQTQYLGHRPKIADSELSDVSGAIKQRVATIEDGLKVTQVDGTVLAYAAGSYRDVNGSLQTIASGQVTLPSSGTNYIWVNTSNAVAFGTTPPVTRLLLAKVITNSGNAISVEDLRSVATRAIAPVAASIKSFGGANESDKTCTNGETFDQGYYYFRNFTVPSGVTITIDKFARFFCSGTVTIDGTVNVSAMAPGSPYYPSVISNAGAIGGLPGSGLGARGIKYPWGAQFYGSGGAMGQMRHPTATGWAYSWAGGDGGGCIWFEAAGSITVNGSIYADGTRGGQGGSQAGAATEGAIGGAAAVGGSGGGSGGLVLLSSLLGVTVSATGIISVRGGNGGNAFSTGLTGSWLVSGGRPGSGGYVVLMSPNNNTTGATIQLTGGAWGTFGTGYTYLDSDTVEYTAVGTPTIVLGGMGGSFGGNVNGTNVTFDNGTIRRADLLAPDQGQLVLRNFVPLGG